MRLTDLLALSYVPRWSIVHTHWRQSVADHSFRVAAIYLELCAHFDISPSLEGLTLAMLHDGAEARSGDIPSTFKKHINGDLGAAEKKVAAWVPDKDKLPPEQRWLVKLADLIEAYTFLAINGVGKHAQRVAEICHDELKDFSKDRWREVQLLLIEIINEDDR